MYCVFNSNNLDTGNYKVLDIDHSELPKVSINKYQLVRADGSIITDKRYGEKIITVKGIVIADNKKQMDERIDTLKTYFTAKNKNLDIYVGDVTRRYTATCQGLSFKINGYHCDWTAQFSCDAFGEAIASTSLTYGTYTTTPTSYAHTIGGTYKTKPYIDLTVNMVEPYWVAGYLQFENAVTNQRLRITRNWNWYDRVVIDGANKTVSVYPTTKTLIDACDVTTGWTLTAGTGTPTLSLETAAMKEGVGCLKGVQAVTAAYLQFNKLNFSPTVDLSSTAGKLIFPIFLPTPTAGSFNQINVYLGSGTTLSTDYNYWYVTTKWGGGSFTANAWNWVELDLSTAPSGTQGTPVRTAIKSIAISFVGTGMQLNGALVDYITLQKASVTAEAQDYEGTFPDLELGSTTLIASDEFDARNISITGSYIKRYL